MKFGTKKSEATEEEWDGEFQPYLRNFREGDNVVRFIQECDDWIKFKEHYTSEGKSYPCSQDDSCPGCKSDNVKEKKATSKYATNVKLVDNDVVLPFRIPMTLAKKLFNRSERNGTITNRDYIVMREGKGMKTEYDLEQDDKRPEDIAALQAQAHDIEEIFQISWDEIWGSGPKKTVAKIVPDGQEEAPPFDSSEEIDEGTLRKMTRAQLADLAVKHSIEFDEDGSKGEILASILASASSDSVRDK